MSGIETVVSEQFLEFESADGTVGVLIEGFEGFVFIEKGSSVKSLSDLFRVEFVFDDLVEDLSEEFNSVRAEDFSEIFSVDISGSSVSQDSSIRSILSLKKFTEFSILQETISISVIFVHDQVHFVGGGEDIDIVHSLLEFKSGDVSLFSQIEASEGIVEVEVFL